MFVCDSQFDFFFVKRIDESKLSYDQYRHSYLQDNPLKKHGHHSERLALGHQASQSHHQFQTRYYQCVQPKCFKNHAQFLK